MASTTPEEFKENLQEYITKLAKSFCITLEGSSIQIRLSSFIEQLAKSKKVVVLIDEYDKPIINHLKHLDIAEKKS